MVIEVMAFRLAAGAGEAEFLAADREVQTGFAYQQPGMVRRTTARGAGGGWIVIDLWQSEADADACAARWDDDPLPRRFMALVDPDSVRTARYTTLD